MPTDWFKAHHYASHVLPGWVCGMAHLSVTFLEPKMIEKLIREQNHRLGELLLGSALREQLPNCR